MEIYNGSDEKKEEKGMMCGLYCDQSRFDRGNMLHSFGLTPEKPHWLLPGRGGEREEKERKELLHHSKDLHHGKQLHQCWRGGSNNQFCENIIA